MCLDILTNEETLQGIANEIGSSVKVKSFIPVIPPVFIRPVVQVKMARFMAPEDHYMFPNDDLMLIGSAEHTLGSQHMNHIFNESDLPIRYAGYSTAFRREAGTYGKDTNGILRQHQFDKLEMEVFSLPEVSIPEQDFLVAIQEYVLRKLGLAYQVVSVCTGDMGFPDYRQIDIETWMPGQNKYRETHSSDHTGGFQARRLNTRVKRSDGKIEPVHMNDATVVAIGRTLIAIIENYQQEDGSIKIPEVLQKYMGGRTAITKKSTS
jgi:seryl-tRNA synthetase